jgi:hypothetical protein
VACVIGACAFGVFIYEYLIETWPVLFSGWWGLAWLVLLALFVLVFLGSLAGIATSFTRLTDRSVKMIIDPHGFHDLRGDKRTVRWDQVSNIRLRAQRTNGVLNDAYLTFELKAGGSVRFDVEGLDSSPETLFELAKTVFQYFSKP